MVVKFRAKVSDKETKHSNVKRPVLLLLLTGIFAFSAFAQEHTDKYKIKTIAIDPGHGGKDPGALGHSTSREKDIVLKVGIKLGQYIEENYPDVKVIFTREKDVFIELHERANIANKAKADLFISIHCNSAAPSAYGTEIYTLGPHRNEENLAVAKKENAVILMEDDYTDHYDGFDPNSAEAEIITSMLQNAHVTQSIDFASRVDSQFAYRVHRKSRGVHQAGFMVLYKTAMPSVLIELGFISNKNEETYLLSDEGTSYMASAIFRAVKNYKNNIEGDLPETVIVKRDDPPVKVEPVVEDEVIFKVQFLVAKQKMVKLDSKYKAITSFETESCEIGYRYLTGSFEDYKEAIRYQNQLISKGVDKAFVVAYKNGKRVTIKEATATVSKRLD